MRLTTAARAELREYLIAHFSLSELETLVEDLGLAYQRLRHATTDDLARDVIGWCERRGPDAIAALIRVVIAARSDAEARFGPWLEALPLTEAPVADFVGRAGEIADVVAALGRAGTGGAAALMQVYVDFVTEIRHSNAEAGAARVAALRARTGAGEASG